MRPCAANERAGVCNGLRAMYLKRPTKEKQSRKIGVDVLL